MYGSKEENKIFSISEENTGSREYMCQIDWNDPKHIGLVGICVLGRMPLRFLF